MHLSFEMFNNLIIVFGLYDRTEIFKKCFGTCRYEKLENFHVWGWKRNKKRSPLFVGTRERMNSCLQTNAGPPHDVHFVL